MRRDLALEWLKWLKVTAVSLANNHSHDFGAEAFAAMKRDLEAAGIAVVEDGAAIEFDDFYFGRPRMSKIRPHLCVIRCGQARSSFGSHHRSLCSPSCTAGPNALPRLRFASVWWRVGRSKRARNSSWERTRIVHRRAGSGAGDRCVGSRWETSSSIKTTRATAAVSSRCASSIKAPGPRAGCRWGMCLRQRGERLPSCARCKATFIVAQQRHRRVKRHP